VTAVTVSSATLGHLNLSVRGATLFTEIFSGGIYICVTKPVLAFVVNVDLDWSKTWLQNTLTHV
jgi:hypothetical protein